MEKIFKCSECGDSKVENLISLTKYGEAYYNMDTECAEYCEKCFQDLEREFSKPLKIDSVSNS